MATAKVDALHELPNPKDFFERYVELRKPVVLRKCCFVKISLEDVRNRVPPETVVEVNVLPSQKKPTFSPKESGPIRVLFSEFMEKLETGLYYLTTQELGVDDEGRPELYSSPISELVGMFPLRPELLANLLPMTYNLWIGHNKDDSGSSSGLHHDFHDNLYCLLQGKKRFHIAPPDSVRKHSMKGSLHTLHGNGRIVYDEQVGQDGMIRPDGALERVQEIVSLEMRKEEIEREIESCEDEERKVELEEELDQVEESILDFEMEGCGEDDSDSEQIPGREKNDSSVQPMAKKARIEKLPLNFVVNESAEVHHDQVVLSEGDMLYLPAGWFHEVFSSGGTHVALNYWMHPPDTEQGFEKPYKSEFWPRDWSARKNLHDKVKV